jgi:hypothetical protein
VVDQVAEEAELVVHAGNRELGKRGERKEGIRDGR